MTEEEAKAEEDKMFERLFPLALLSLETLIEAAAAVIAGQKRIKVEITSDGYELCLVDAPAVKMAKIIPDELEGRQLDAKAAALKVKDKFGTEEAKALIKKHGGGLLSDLLKQPDKFDAFIAEAEKMLNPLPAKND